MAKIVNNKLGFLEEERAQKLAIDTLQKILKRNFNLSFEEDKENKYFFIRGKRKIYSLISRSVKI